MNKLKKIICIMVSFVTTMCIGLDYIYNIGGFSGNDFRWIIIFFIMCLVIYKAVSLYEKRLYKYSIIFSFIISLCATVGRIAEKYLVSNLSIGMKDTIVILGQFESTFVCVMAIAVVILSYLPRYLENINSKKEWKIFTANKKSVFIIALFLFIAYLPYVLYYYPGNILIDSTVQIMQGMGAIEFTTHHPPIHTAIITVCVKLGNSITGSYNFGAFIYTLGQTISTCFLFSYAIYYMARKGVPRIIRIICVLFYAFCPTISFLTITMYKDIPFALSLLALTICVTELATNMNGFTKHKIRIIVTILTVFLVSIFRNNGLYAIILSIPIIFVMLKKNRAKVCFIFIIGAGICLFVTGPIYSKLGIEKGSSKEAFSVILQQYARVTKYKGEELSEEEKKSIHKYLPVDNIADLYDPVFADPVKHQFSDIAFREDKSTLFKTYFHLATKYPAHTIASLICNSFGYYYPNTLGWGVYKGVDDECFSNNGVDYGIKESPIVEITFLDNINEFVNSRNIPIVSMFISIGFLFWLLIFGIIYCIYTKKYKLIVTYVPLLCMWITILASPVFGEPRYVYGLFTCLPLLLGISLKNNINDLKE